MAHPSALQPLPPPLQLCPRPLRQLAQLRAPRALAGLVARTEGVTLWLGGPTGADAVPLAVPARSGVVAPLPSCLTRVGSVPRVCPHGLVQVRPVLHQGQVVVVVAAHGLPESEAAQARVADGLAAVVADLECYLGSTAAPVGDFDSFFGDSPQLRTLRQDLRRAALSSYPVLIQGESGTGKDLAAWLVHHQSARGELPFVTLNCAALPDQLLESELFGHRRGSFTGADRDKPGLFAVAGKGTIFLDEIQQLSPQAQAKLLRVTESGEFWPLGAAKAERSAARLVVATNSDVDGLVAQGSFRRDLFYRLSVLRLRTVPLREIRGDIAGLVLHFLRLTCAREGVPTPAISAELLDALAAHDWPGNVRQLIHEIERLVVRAEGHGLSLAHLSPELQPRDGNPRRFQDRRERIAQAWEKSEILRALEAERWNVVRTAKALNLSRRALIEKMQRLGLTRPA